MRRHDHEIFDVVASLSSVEMIEVEIFWQKKTRVDMIYGSLQGLSLIVNDLCYASSISFFSSIKYY